MRVLRRAPALVLVLVLALGACGDDDTGPDPAADLAAARAVWQAHALDEYRYVISASAGGRFLGRYLVTVNGERTESEMLAQPFDGDGTETWASDLGGLFDRVEGVLGRTADDRGWLPEYLIVEYHPQWGFPIRIREHDPRTTGGGQYVVVAGFATGDGPLTLTALPTVEVERARDPGSGLSDDQVLLAVEIALTDAQVEDYLALQGYQVDRIAEQVDNGGTVLVEAELDRPVAPAHWPVDHCGGLTQSRIYRVRWTVDLDQQTVLEVCGY